MKREAAKKQAEREASRRTEEKRLADAKAKEDAEKAKLTAQTTPKKAESKSESKKETKQRQKTVKVQRDNKERSYADARKRSPRSDASTSKTLPAPVKTESTATKQTPAVQKASGFASSRGSLPKPSSNGFKVVSKFGPHPLPDLPAVTYDNPGIDAEVTPGASAVAVYPGTVSGVYVVKGFSTVIIVNHGSHYTVYGNLASPAVKKGDNVKQGQALGRVASDADDGNRSILHFEVWRGRDKLNPLEWIR